MMTSKHKYVRCSENDIPAGVRFDVPQRNAGQIVEIAYGGLGRAEHDEGDEYMRRHDRSLGPLAFEFYRLAK